MKQMRRIRDIVALTVHASDGEVGGIRELYFDSRSWSVRYLVVKTGGWLFGRDALIAPVGVERIDDEQGIMRVRLTKASIEQAPPVETAQPLSREFEEAYFRHFDWAPYWQPGPAAWGSAVPYPELPSSGPAAAFPVQLEQATIRSSSEMTGYGIHARNGEIGHVEDLVVDDEDWIVRYVEVDQRHWLPGKKVLLQTSRIEGVDWEARLVNVGLTRQAIESAPPYDPSQLITPDYEVRLFNYYGTAAA